MNRYHKKIKETIKEVIKDLYQKGFTAKEIAKKLNLIDYRTVLYHIHKMDIRLRKNLKELKITSSQLTPEKAYILGVLAGDGYLRFDTKDKRHVNYQICLSVTNKEFARYFAFCLEKVFGLIPSWGIAEPEKKQHNKRYVVRLSSKLACLDLFNYNVSFKGSEWRLPNEIKNSSEDIKCMYIKGFADSEGCVVTNGRRIELASKNRIGLEELKELLVSLGIRDCSIGQNSLVITARKSLELFAREINFTIPYKQENLQKLLKNYKRSITSGRRMKELIPFIISLKKGGLSNQEISDELKISTTAVRDNLNRLNVKDSQEQTEFLGVK